MLRCLLFLLPALLMAQISAFQYLKPGARAWFYFSFDTRSEPYPDSLLLTASANGKQYTLKRVESLSPFWAAEYIVPLDVPVGDATVEIPRKPDTRAPATVTSYPLNFIYGTYGGFAYAQQQRGREAFRPNSLTEPARRGDRITMWATGLDEAEITMPYSADATVIQAVVTHQSDGLDRIEFTLPDDAPGQCYFPLYIRSQRYYVATAEPGTGSCPHPLGLEPKDLLRLDRGLGVPVAAISLSPWSTSVQIGDFGKDSFPSIFPLGVPQANTAGSYGCRIYNPRFVGSMSASFSSPAPPQLRGELVAPDGQVFSNTVGSFPYWFPVRLQQPGPWKFRRLPREFESGSGEELDFEVPPLSKFHELPDWSKFSAKSDLVVEWEPAAGEPQGLVRVGMRFRPRDWLGTGELMTLECAQPMTAGRLVVPASLMGSVDAAMYDRIYPSLSVKWNPRVFRATDGRYVLLNFEFRSEPPYEFGQ